MDTYVGSLVMFCEGVHTYVGHVLAQGTVGNLTMLCVVTVATDDPRGNGVDLVPADMVDTL